MSIISQKNENEVAILDCVQRFFSSYKVGGLLKQCNGTKEKGVPAISLLRYKLSNVFTGRSMYMQQRTGSFKEGFSKNTFYRFLNSSKTNWLRFTSSLASIWWFLRFQLHMYRIICPISTIMVIFPILFINFKPEIYLLKNNCFIQTYFSSQDRICNNWSLIKQESIHRHLL